MKRTIIFLSSRPSPSHQEQSLCRYRWAWVATVCLPSPSQAGHGIFGKELGGLLSAYATDIRITIEPVNGHQVTKVVSDVEAAEEDVTGQVDITLPDLIAEETRHIVFATKLQKQKQAFPRPATIFNIKVIYSQIAPDGKKETKTEEAKARVQFVKADEADKAPNKELDAIVGLAEMVRIQIEAEEKAKSGDYTTASSMLDQMSRNLHHRGHERLGAVSSSLSARVASAPLYAANGGYLRSVQSGGTRAYGASGMDHQAQVDLMGANVSISNSVMDNMVRSFTEPGPGPLVGVVHAQPTIPSVNFGDLGANPFGGVGGLDATGTVLPLGGQSWVAGAGDPAQLWSAQPAVTAPPTSPAPVAESSSQRTRIRQGRSRNRW